MSADKDLEKTVFEKPPTPVVVKTEVAHVPDASEILKKSLKSGISGASAMVIQVLSLMWMRTTMNYQFKNGGGFLETVKKLYAEGGIPRFYRGVAPALIIGPISRFGDTAANLFALTLFKRSPQADNLPIFIKTSVASFCAGCWRLITIPVDAWKTSKQVNGADGLKMLLQKYRANGIGTFYQGAVASALGTMAGHYPWFVTYNYLDHYLTKYSFKENTMKALARSAFIGFCGTMISDTVSNSIRVVKTIKQTSKEKISYQ